MTDDKELAVGTVSWRHGERVPKPTITFDAPTPLPAGKIKIYSGKGELLNEIKTGADNENT